MKLRKSVRKSGVVRRRSFSSIHAGVSRVIVAWRGGGIGRGDREGAVGRAEEGDGVGGE